MSAEGEKPDGGGASAFDMGAVIGSLSQDNRTTMERKGWLKDGKPTDNFKLDSVLDSYRGLESLTGKRTLEEPNLADPEAFQKWPGHKLLGGVPEKPEAYDFGERPQLPEGLKWSEREGDGGIPWDAAGEKMLRVAMHKAGIYGPQAKAMMKEIVADRIASVVSGQTNRNVEKTTIEGNLSRDFGTTLPGAKEAGMQALSQIAKLAKVELGPVIDGFAVQMGNEAATRFVIQLGRMMGEDKLAGGGANNGFATSREAALAEIENMKADKDVRAALFDRNNPAHKQTNEKWQRLNKISQARQPQK